MRQLTYFVASTVDGYIAPPDGSDPTGELLAPQQPYLARLIAQYPEIVPGPAREALGVAGTPNRHFDTVIEGRNSYQLGLDAGVPDAYPHLRHIVFSRTMTTAPAPAVEVRADPVATVRTLKQDDGQGIWLVGGAQLARTLRAEIDRLVVKLHPVIAGSGIPMFGGEHFPERLRLESTEEFDGGYVHLAYVREPVI